MAYQVFGSRDAGAAPSHGAGRSRDEEDEKDEEYDVFYDRFWDQVERDIKKEEEAKKPGWLDDQFDD